MINTPLVIGLLSQVFGVVALALALALDKPRYDRYRRMALILGIGLLVFGAAMVDIEVLLP